jgi:hypothetical protein
VVPAVISNAKRKKLHVKICPTYHPIGELRRCFVDHGTEAMYSLFSQKHSAIVEQKDVLIRPVSSSILHPISQGAVEDEQIGDAHMHDRPFPTEDHLTTRQYFHGRSIPVFGYMLDELWVHGIHS